MVTTYPVTTHIHKGVMMNVVEKEGSPGQERINAPIVAHMRGQQGPKWDGFKHLFQRRYLPATWTLPDFGVCLNISSLNLYNMVANYQNKCGQVIQYL